MTVERRDKPIWVIAETGEEFDSEPEAEKADKIRDLSIELEDCEGICDFLEAAAWLLKHYKLEKK